MMTDSRVMPMKELAAFLDSSEALIFRGPAGRQASYDATLAT